MSGYTTLTGPDGQTAISPTYPLPVTVAGQTGASASQVQGAGAAGAAVVGNPVLVAGSDGTNTRTIKTDSAASVFVNTEGQKATYTVAGGITPTATTVQFLQLKGSATKTVRITNIHITMVATTAANNVPVFLNRYSATTTGTAVTPAPLPLDTNDAAATAVATTYVQGTAGTSVGILDWVYVTEGSATVSPTAYVWTAAPNSQGLVLRGIADFAVLSTSIPSVTGASIAYSITWTEE